jgi:hypothetical protein
MVAPSLDARFADLTCTAATAATAAAGRRRPPSWPDVIVIRARESRNSKQKIAQMFSSFVRRLYTFFSGVWKIAAYFPPSLVPI